MNDACREFSEKGKALGEPDTEAELVEFMDSALAFSDELQSDLADIKPPAEAEELHAALQKALDDTIDKGREAQEALEGGDLEGFQTAMEESSELGSAADEEADEFGLTECGSKASGGDDS